MSDSKNLLSIPIISNLPLDGWIGSLTIFNDAYKTIPKEEITGTWKQISGVLRPHDPLIIEDKTKGVFVLPYQLQEAPLVGKTC